MTTRSHQTGYGGDLAAVHHRDFGRVARFNYAFDRRTSMSSVTKLFRRVHDALEPRGVFMFDIAGPGRAGPRGESEGWHDRDDYTLFFRVTEDAARSTLVREIVLFTRTADTYRRSDETHVLRLYDPREIEARLRTTGFKVRRLRGYGVSRSVLAGTPFWPPSDL